MQGNVSEWCSDWAHYKYYETSPSKDPQGFIWSIAEMNDEMLMAQSGRRVTRGGSCKSEADELRSARRGFCDPIGANLIGFRCAQDL